MDSVEVAVVGSLNADLTVPVDRLPTMGETILGGDTTSGPGGKGGNQAVAAARLGASVAMVAAVADDDDGRYLTTSLRTAGVDTTAVDVVSRPTGKAVVLLSPDGSNAIIVSPGANAALDEARIDGSAGLLGAAAVVLAQLEIPAASVAAAFSASSGVTVLNPAPASPDAADLIDVCSVVVPNQSELALLVGADSPPADAEGAVEMARRLVGPTRSVVVTLGARGAVVVSPERPPVDIPSRPASVVDTTGAGDAFCGALAVGLARGMDVVDAARVAVEAGGIAVGHRGALPPVSLSELVGRLPAAR